MDNSKDYLLRVSNLQVELQNQIILENVTFQIKKGTTMAIVGPNGAGKTMFFKTLLGLIPYSGKIEWAETLRR